MNPATPAGLGSRRALLAGAGGGIALMLAACGSSTGALTPHVAPSQRARDVQAMNSLLDLVHPSIAAYEAGVPLLRGEIARASRQLLSEELEHAGRLQALIRARQAVPRPPASGYALGHPRTSREVLELLHGIEDREVDGLLRTLPHVSQELRPQLASILANNAQHLSILRAALGRPAVPAAFLTTKAE